MVGVFVLFDVPGPQAPSLPREAAPSSYFDIHVHRGKNPVLFAGLLRERLSASHYAPVKHAVSLAVMPFELSGGYKTVCLDRTSNNSAASLVCLQRGRIGDVCAGHLSSAYQCRPCGFDLCLACAKEERNCEIVPVRDSFCARCGRVALSPLLF
jgi:hypothetical protein